MNIAVIAKTRLPIIEPFRGGLEAFTHAICKEYMRLGHTVTLYAHADSDPTLNLVSFYGDTYRADPAFEIIESDEYVSILKDISSKDFDVIHNNSTHQLPLLWGVKASVPVVTTLHAPPQYSKIKPAITAASDATNLHFITVSQSLGDTWSPYLRRGSSVVHNGIDLDAWPLIRSSSEYLFWFGRIVPTKRLDIALDVAHALDMPLRFAGSKDDEAYFNDQIEPRISQADTYIGHLDRQALSAAMSGAAVMINAARWEEPFGLTNIEAMASGVPIAGFDRGAFKEIVDDASGVVAVDATIAALADAARRAKQLSSSGARARAEQFSITTMAEKYITYFESIV